MKMAMIVLLAALALSDNPMEAGNRRHLGGDTIANVIHHLELPSLPKGDLLVRHAAYTLAYREKNEQASWVAYQLTAEETQGPAERSNRFMEDPLVTTGSARDEDYAGSGYDRGHLAPAGDMTWSETSMVESFYYSNMSPQAPSFNRGIWKQLETLVRDWAQECSALEIVTGPVLTGDLPVIGPSSVSIPQMYYKAVLDYRQPGIRAAGFLLRNEASNEPLWSFMVPIDSIEHVTGIDFFPRLPDVEEERLESRSHKADWTWNPDLPQRQRTERQDDNQPEGSSVQCSGITKAGQRCRNRTTDPSGRCHLHKD